MDIKEIRKEKGLTQQQSADFLGISRRSYQTLEKEGAESNEQKYDYYCSLLAGGDMASSATREKLSFKTSVITGSALNSLRSKVEHYEKRNIYKYLLDYINNDYSGKVCILYGLRRTGKTTLLL